MNPTMVRLRQEIEEMQVMEKRRELQLAESCLFLRVARPFNSTFKS
jgi:hypothetical protein